MSIYSRKLGEAGTWQAVSRQSSYMTKLHRTSHSFYLCSTRLTIRQAQVDKLYASLKELAGERRERLQEHLRLCQLRRELDDLEQWIQEREVVAASHELGQDYEHVTVSAMQISTRRDQGPQGDQSVGPSE